MLRASCVRLSERAPLPTRTYWYDVDVHGQVFLSGTKIRNFSSCQKDPAFLAFFYHRLQRRRAALASSSASSSSSPRWSGDDDTRNGQLSKPVYPFVSYCGREVNYVRAVDTPLVFTSLTPQGELMYAGLEKHAFDPRALKADDRGYLYHPSPISARAQAAQSRAPSRRRRRRPESFHNSASGDTTNATEIATGNEFEYGFGPYSLLRSSLVLDAFAESLDLGEDEPGGGRTGSIEWKGRRYAIGRLEPDEAWNDQPWDPDSDSDLDMSGQEQGKES